MQLWRHKGFNRRVWCKSTCLCPVFLIFVVNIIMATGTPFSSCRVKKEVLQVANVLVLNFKSKYPGANTEEYFRKENI